MEEYNPNKEHKILIAFVDMIDYILSNIKLEQVITNLFISGRKLNNFFVFIAQIYFTVPKNIRLNSAHFLLRKLQTNKLQQIPINLSSSIGFRY